MRLQQLFQPAIQSAVRPALLLADRDHAHSRNASEMRRGLESGSHGDLSSTAFGFVCYRSNSRRLAGHWARGRNHWTEGLSGEVAAGDSGCFGGGKALSPVRGGKPLVRHADIHVSHLSN
jgi:hypothetical protein